RHRRRHGGRRGRRHDPPRGPERATPRLAAPQQRLVRPPERIALAGHEAAVLPSPRGAAPPHTLGERSAYGTAALSAVTAAVSCWPAALLSFAARLSTLVLRLSIAVFAAVVSPV